MTREEAIKGLKSLVKVRRKYGDMQTMKDEIECLDMAIKALEQEPTEFEEIDFVQEHKKIPVTLGLTPYYDAISRQAVLGGLASIAKAKAKSDAQKSLMGRVMFFTERLPSVNPQPKTGHCKECKYFEYNSVVKVDGIPLIVAHEICSRWGDGCKTREDGYCFLFEPQESEVQDADSN